MQVGQMRKTWVSNEGLARSESRNKNIICHGCRKRGHIRNSCPYRKKKYNNSTSQTSEQKTGDVFIAHEDKGVDVLVAFESTSRYSIDGC